MDEKRYRRVLRIAQANGTHPPNTTDYGPMSFLQVTETGWLAGSFVNPVTLSRTVQISKKVAADCDGETHVIVGHSVTNQHVSLCQ
jgi:hypothetical protein